jgi:phosphohistidine phosphatase
MHILVVRHGEAIDETAGGDAYRALTGRGRKRTRKVAEWLARSKGRRPVEIWVSPLVRAVQTAEILAEHAKIGDAVVVMPELSPGRDPREVAELVGKREAARPLAIVGHEPGLSLLVGVLLSEPNWPAIKKSGVIAIERGENGAMAFAFALDPKTLKVVRDPAALRVEEPVPA